MDYPNLAIRIQIEQATLLQQANRLDEATPLMQAAFVKIKAQYEASRRSRRSPASSDS